MVNKVLCVTLRCIMESWKTCIIYYAGMAARHVYSRGKWEQLPPKYILCHPLSPRKKCGCQVRDVLDGGPVDLSLYSLDTFRNLQCIIIIIIIIIGNF